ncbi:MAG: Spy/CpxP family protein refolding chaperone [Bacteroidia bacterium]|nr:Spy/CpxP family protein refolding chaperone [Bacteroidia bacterium]
MKKIIAIAVLSIMVMGQNNLFAQKGRGGYANGKGKQEAQKIAAKLNLNDEQKEKVKEIRSRHRNEIQEQLKANPKMEKRERRQLMLEHMKSADAEIQSILTPEQQTIYKQEKERLKNERMEKRELSKGKKKGNKVKEAEPEEKELEDALIESL